MEFQVAHDLSPFVYLYIVPLAWKLLGGIAVWIIGGWIVRIFRSALQRFMSVRHVDPTLARYVDAGAHVLLKLLVLVVVLGVVGIETTSFAALLAAAGIAIGAAWSGLLANFAAGLFLLTFRPFKVGDQIAAAGVTGTVMEVGLFTTTIETPDRVQAFVGNNKLFADTVQNFSISPFRRVDVSAQVPGGIDLEQAAHRLRADIASIPNVLDSPPVSVEILAFSPTGATLAARPFCRNEHYWQVYFDTMRAISRMFAQAS